MPRRRKKILHEEKTIKMNDLQFKQLLNRLDVLARLLALNLPEKMSQQDIIEILTRMNMKPKDIAVILGTTSNTVSVALHSIKKKKSSKNQKKDE